MAAENGAQAMTESLNECITIGKEDTYIVIHNKCSNDIYIARIEVAYYITGLTTEPGEKSGEHKRVRRRIEEKIRVNDVVKGRDQKRVYFGPTENIEEIWVVAGLSRDDLRKIKVV